MRNVGSVLTGTRNASFRCMKCPNSDRRLAQLVSAQKENPYKVKAYRRAAANIRTLSESVEELVRHDADVTVADGSGAVISRAKSDQRCSEGGTSKT